MERHSNIAALNEGNYTTWKLQMKMALIKEDLFRIESRDIAEYKVEDLKYLLLSIKRL